MFSNRLWCFTWMITLVIGSVLYLLLVMMLSLDSPKITSNVPSFITTMSISHTKTADKSRIISHGKNSIIIFDKPTVHKEGLFLKKFYLLFLPPGTVLRPGFPFGGIGKFF